MAGARGNRRIFDLGNKTLFMREYGDFSPEYTDYATAAVAILPVPYDGTSTWIKGADKGPEALLDASFNLEFYDIETDTEVFRRGIATLEPVTEDASPEAMAAAVEQRMDRVIADGKFPVLIGGEHSVSIGAFRSMGKRYGDELSIVQFDAHSDMRDSYEGSTHNHACVMARALEVTRSVTQRPAVETLRIYNHRPRRARPGLLALDGDTGTGRAGLSRHPERGESNRGGTYGGGTRRGGAVPEPDGEGIGLPGGEAHLSDPFHLGNGQLIIDNGQCF